MTGHFKKSIALLCFLSAAAAPLSAHAIFDFGGRVTNVPGTLDSIMFASALPVFPPEGYDTFWDSEQGICLNGVEEVDQIQAAGVPQPPILLQFVGAYTFSAGPATHPGQEIMGKYIPAMVCMMTYVFWVTCGPSLCPVVVPLPFFFDPLIIYNGSSPV